MALLKTDIDLVRLAAEAVDGTLRDELTGLASRMKDSYDKHLAELVNDCTIHDHHRPVCAACCYTDNGYCMCSCHTNPT